MPAADPATFDQIEGVLNNILGTTARLIGLAVFVMLIVGGYQLLTAAGDPKKADLASKTITGAITGLVIIIGGWLLIQLLETLTGANLTKLNLHLGS